MHSRYFDLMIAETIEVMNWLIFISNVHKASQVYWDFYTNIKLGGTEGDQIFHHSAVRNRVRLPPTLLHKSSETS